ncbi:MAG: DUF3267 domain-containing protein [Solobacterium sp.]|nr:DUF3267 domain-containing protein [Solobacterium sp.]
MAENGTRKLTKAETRRLEALHETEKRMEGQGYRETLLTIDMGKANAFALFLLIPLFVTGFGAYYLIHRTLGLGSIHNGMLFFAAGLLILIVVHELIHGVTWAIHSENHFRDIEFGFMVSAMAPYCTCASPLKKSHYVTGALMPLILLGIIPTVVSLIIGSPVMLLLGLFLIDGAAGDILIVDKLMKYKTDAAEILYLDHPTEAGLVVFER